MCYMSIKSLYHKKAIHVIVTNSNNSVLLPFGEPVVCQGTVNNSQTAESVG